MNHDAYADDYIREILNGVKTIAMVGASPVNVRPSYFAFKYLAQRGYDMIPVNPGASEILGAKAYPDLLSIPRPVDVVQVFRPSADVPPVVDQAIQIGAKVVWMQLGIYNAQAAEKARAAGLLVVMDHCMREEHKRLIGQRIIPNSSL